MLNSGFNHLKYFLVFSLFILSACGTSNERDQGAIVEEEQINLTRAHGELAIALLEDYVKDWEDKDVDVLGVRVFDYAENGWIKMIGCTRERFTLSYPNNEIFAVDREFRRIYVFWFYDSEWKLKTGFFLSNDSQTYHDWWYLPEDQKDIIGELPDYNHWNCLFFVENLNGF